MMLRVIRPLSIAIALAALTGACGKSKPAATAPAAERSMEAPATGDESESGADPCADSAAPPADGADPCGGGE